MRDPDIYPLNWERANDNLAYRLRVCDRQQQYYIHSHHLLLCWC